MLEGGYRFTVLDGEGDAYEADLRKRDIWYAPKGRPHSTQEVGKDGSLRVHAYFR
jgi:oxalate decarboxylase/phosphoglucose isomerase-like protein (cupin superfamily)